LAPRRWAPPLGRAVRHRRRSSPQQRDGGPYPSITGQSAIQNGRTPLEWSDPSPLVEAGGPTERATCPAIGGPVHVLACGIDDHGRLAYVEAHDDERTPPTIGSQRSPTIQHPWRWHRGRGSTMSRGRKIDRDHPLLTGGNGVDSTPSPSFSQLDKARNAEPSGLLKGRVDTAPKIGNSFLCRFHRFSDSCPDRRCETPGSRVFLL